MGVRSLPAVPRQVLRNAALIAACLLMARVSFAQAALLIEEPFGKFGEFTATGHAAIYLSRVCAETPTKLRRCEPEENGVIISRYARVGGYDWVAIPIVPYLYAVDDLKNVPAQANAASVAALRDQYRREHLSDIKGHNWEQLIGAAYDRRIYAFGFPTSEAQDDALIAKLNSAPNVSHFSLVFHNCADFARSIIDFDHPGAVRRSISADSGITTPKQIAKSLVHFEKRDRELEQREFVIPQVPGSIPRSRPIHGVLESILKSKKYVIPIAVLHPAIAASLAASYIGGGRFNPARAANPLDASPSNANLQDPLQQTVLAVERQNVGSGKEDGVEGAHSASGGATQSSSNQPNSSTSEHN